MKITGFDIVSHLGVDNTDQIIQLAEQKIGEIFQELEILRNAYLSKQKEYDDLLKAIQVLKSALELKSNLSKNEGYSKDWKWPTKTLFILKQIKRPLTAKEVIKLIEIYEGQVPDDKKSAVFTALSNLAKEGKIVRDKPGAEYVYCMPAWTQIVISNEFENIDDLSKEQHA